MDWIDQAPDARVTPVESSFSSREGRWGPSFADPELKVQSQTSRQHHGLGATGSCLLPFDTEILRGQWCLLRLNIFASDGICLSDVPWSATRVLGALEVGFDCSQRGYRYGKMAISYTSTYKNSPNGAGLMTKSLSDIT